MRDRHLNSISHTTFHQAAAEDGKQLVYHKLQQNVYTLYDHRLSFPITRRSIIGQRFYFLIPQFRQTLVLCCSRRQVVMNGQGKEERANVAAFLKPALQLRSSHPESSQVQQTSDRQKVMDTKL